jgi:hypothetical protein
MGSAVTYDIAHCVSRASGCDVLRRHGIAVGAIDSRRDVGRIRDDVIGGRVAARIEIGKRHHGRWLAARRAAGKAVRAHLIRRDPTAIREKNLHQQRVSRDKRSNRAPREQYGVA